MCQAEAIIACAPVISRDVDALMDTATIVFGRALIDICKKKKTSNKDIKASTLIAQICHVPLSEQQEWWLENNFC